MVLGKFAVSYNRYARRSHCPVRAPCSVALSGCSSRFPTTSVCISVPRSLSPSAQFSSVIQWCPTLQPHGLQPTRLLSPWGSSRQESWSGLPFRTPGYLPDSRTEPMSLMSPALAVIFFPTTPTWEAQPWDRNQVSHSAGRFFTI